MKIYVAGGSLDRSIVASYMRRLEAMGIEVTLDWPHVVDTANADAELTEEERHRFARADLGGVDRADVFWLQIPSYKGSVGAWIEYGYALSKGKTVVVSGDRRVSIFTAEASRIFDTHDSAFAWIVGRR